MKKVVATETAKALIEKLQKLHGSLALIHSEGCCDGTSPICLKRDDFYLGSQDKKIGEITLKKA